VYTVPGERSLHTSLLPARQPACQLQISTNRLNYGKARLELSDVVYVWTRSFCEDRISASPAAATVLPFARFASLSFAIEMKFVVNNYSEAACGLPADTPVYGVHLPVASAGVDGVEREQGRRSLLRCRNSRAVVRA